MSVGANCHVDACMGGFVLPFAEMLGQARRAVGLPGRGRHDHLGRHPQARIRTEGRFGHPPPHQGITSVPDVRVRRLARRLLRLAEHAGHPLGSADGLRLGGDVAPRDRRLRRPDPPDAGERRPDAGRDRGASTGSECSATVPSTWSPWPPIPRRRATSTCSRVGDALLAKGWYHDRQTPPDNLHSTVSNTNTGVIEEYLADLAACVEQIGAIDGWRTARRRTPRSSDPPDQTMATGAASSTSCQEPGSARC